MSLECYLKNYATWMFREKGKLTHISETKPGADLPWGVGSRTLFYPINIILQTFIKDSGNLKHPKNMKSINNATGSHIVSFRVIPKPATVKWWKKEMLKHFTITTSNFSWFTRNTKNNCFAKHILLLIKY